MKQLRFVLVGWVVLVAAGWRVPAQAQPVAPGSEETEIVVTAQRPTEIRVEVPASVSVITRQDIERTNATKLVDVLKLQPGVWAGQQNGGFSSWIQVRGMGQHGGAPVGALVLVDGHPDMMGIMGHAVPMVQLLDHVERVEILRGPASTQYGSMALGGVINVITRRPPDKTLVDGFVEGGSFGTINGQLRGGTSLGKLSFSLSGGHRATDGSLDNRWGQSAFAQFGLNVDMRWSDNTTTRFRGGTTNLDVVNLSSIASQLAAGKADAAITSLHQHLYRRDFGLTTDWKSGASTSSLGLFYNPSHHKFDDNPGQPGSGFDATDFVVGANWRQNFQVSPSGTFSWGADFQRTGGKVYNAGWPPFAPRKMARNEGAVYLSGSGALESGERVSAALRAQAVQGFRMSWLPSIGVEIPQKEGAFRLSLRSGYRTPSFRELYLSGSLALRPERTYQAEVGYNYPIRGGGEFDIAAYHTWAKDLILAGPYDLTGQSINVPDVRLKGVDVGLRKRLGPAVSGYVNYSFLDPGTAKPYNVANKFTVGTDVRRGKLGWSADIQGFDKVWGVANKQLAQLPGAIIANTRLTYAMSADYQLSLGVDNLLDHSYRIDPALPARITMPGRCVVFGIRARR